MLLHHVGIVVDNLAEAIPLFKVWMGARPIGGIVEDEAQGARIQLFLMNTDTLLEVVEPIRSEEATSFHQTGEFHLCFTVPDLDVEMKRLHDMGAVVIHPNSRAPLFGNNRIGFMATNSGQLLELLEDASVPVQ
ncbi:MAG: VOC family protein [Armatimonadota bacterium]